MFSRQRTMSIYGWPNGLFASQLWVKMVGTGMEVLALTILMVAI